MNALARRLSLTMAGTLSAVSLSAGASQALPPGGASPDTPGTSATLSQRSLTPGATISFRITGFPASEVVSVKIDDGEFCSAKGVHGACVVHQQKSSKDGSMSGSFALPSDLAPGKHWLRFLASSEMKDADGNYLGVKPYSLTGDTTFTIAAAKQRSGSTGNGSSKSGTSGTAGSTPTAGSNAGSTSGVTTPGTSAGAATPGTAGTASNTESTTPDETPVPGALRVPAGETADASTSSLSDAAQQTEAPVTLASSEVQDDARFPWVGAGVLAICLGFGVALTLRGRSVRRA